MSELNTDQQVTLADEAEQADAGTHDTETAGGMTVEELRAWLRNWVSKAAGLPVDQIADDRPMDEFGLASRDAVSLAADIEDRTGVVLTATVAYNHPTIALLAKRIIEGDPDEGRGDDDRFWERERAAADDIAIVGFATRFPGAGHTPESTWEALVAGKSGISDLPEDRWSEFKQDPKLAKIIADANVQGGYLDDVKSFDADFFQMSPREVEMVDPQQRLALELTWEALEHAHIPASDLKGADVGVFLGTSTNDYQMLATMGLGDGASDTAAYALTGTSTSIVANRVSYYFDFRGPSVALDTACSSSLVAVHQAVRSLRNGESTIALAGGVNMILTPAASLGFDSIGMIAADGKIKTFSADADGIGRAEGGGVFVLKRVADARRDGDPILAVIAGSAVNSDGRSNGLPAPNPEAQVDVLRSAYADAALDPSSVDYVEAHGTGTVLGDPIEADALGRVVGRGRLPGKPLLMGSVKTNYGHMESAAGAGALAKVVLSLQHNQIPASLNFTEPNPYIQFAANSLAVTTEATEWPRYSGHAVAGISGFGFGGTNAHIVVRETLPTDLADTPASPTSPVEARGAQATNLETTQADNADADADDDEYLTEAERAILAAQARKSETDTTATEKDQAEGFAPCAAEGSVVPLVVSGFLPSRRRKSAADIADWLETEAGQTASLVSVGRTLASRNHGRSRAVVMARSHEDAIKGLRAIADGKSNPIVYSADAPDAASAVWLLSGYGSQHRKMAKQLYTENPVFAKYLDRVDEFIDNELGYKIADLVLDDEETYNSESAQVAIYAIQVSLSDTLQHFGAKPGVLVPHSMGEASAAYISGGLSLEDATRVICQRSRLMAEGEAGLSEDEIRNMALVEYSADDITGVLVDYPDLEICVYAAPTHTVIGGPPDQVDAILARAEAEGKLGRKLLTKGASHTEQVEPILGELAYEIAGIGPRPLEYGIYSSIDCEEFYRPGGKPIHEVEYFLKGLRHSVWFAQAVAKTVEAGHRTFLELSPNPAVLISVAGTTFGAGVHNAELIETLRRKEDESFGVINALMKLYVHGHPVDVAALFGVDDADRSGGYAAVPRTRFERKEFWLTASYSAGGTGTAPGAHVALPDGRHAWEVNASAVTDPRALVAAAAGQVLSGVTVGAVETHAPIPASGTVTTTLSPHPGGASVAMYAQDGKNFRLLFEAAVTAGSVPPQTAADAETSPAAVFADNTLVVEDEIVENAGDRWTPESGESVHDRLATIVGESMGYDPQDLPFEVPLIDLGLDSLMAVRIKNRVEYEFDIPQLQLQAMRSACLADVEKFTAFAVTHRDQLDNLAENAAAGGELNTEAINAYIDEQLAKDAASSSSPVEVTASSDEATSSSPVEVTASSDEATSSSPVEVTASSGEATSSSPVEVRGAQATSLETPQADNVPAIPVADSISSQEAAAAAAGSDVPPRDAAERLTFGVYAVITKKSAGGIFNKLPVLDEDTAQALTDRLNERTGGDIDIEDILDSETIEEMSNYVREYLDAAADVDGFVRYLRLVPEGKKSYDTTAGDPVPVLLFHPAGGNTSAYETLLKRLPADQPVIGFDRVEGSMEERVRQYLPRIREVQPHGPYVFVGWSLGGGLAYGAAQLMREEGEEVAFIGLIDTVMPAEREIETPETKRARLERWKDFAVKTYDLDPDVPIPMDRLVEADDEGQFRIIMEMVSMSGAKIPGGIIEHQRTSFIDNRALANIEPSAYDGKVVLYRADRMHDGAIELDPQWAKIDADGGWGPIVSDLEIVQIGGDHLSMVDEPYISTIGADLTARLRGLGKN
ncbi:acyltransferase domain-containing protein [Gordonia amarae]|uniref:Polyketide synthase Pks13 n=2 Tax=Gordonia amarae TaxID=36821 RepID=G7GLL8_9ACTN|nr:polyketide synthase Pks13 [Gordonia amarae]MCS3876575.1 polyketide synthase 13 [Gordonia amarae]QHN19470.1 acyltransferase domain-containing protein [Gordonia amarae]QHN23946.1 acyltransferase domain-containing protein [Gordonia amarae]QHN32854.1 acyltransferase domain-containing protein [Gordonia amarae]QHN41573.1 acyltransferase domain-containing protein [Gordonia amarae]